MNKVQGALPDYVFKNKRIQEYIKDQSPLFGYLGHSNRNRFTDDIMVGLYDADPNLVAEFMCSRIARHVMDMISDETGEEKIESLFCDGIYQLKVEEGL